MTPADPTFISSWPVYPPWLFTGVLWAGLAWFVVLIVALLTALIRRR